MIFYTVRPNSLIVFIYIDIHLYIYMCVYLQNFIHNKCTKIIVGRSFCLGEIKLSLLNYLDQFVHTLQSFSFSSFDSITF